jgi:hypothetical protein
MTSTTTTHCLRCGRALKAAKSIEDGMGRTCKAKVRAAAQTVDLSAFKDAKAAAAKAEQLIEDGAIVPTQHAGQYVATSTDGTTVYLVDAIERSCTCKGHQRVGRCYHLVAAEILHSAAPARRAA